jgi:metallo-beta-lactamase family protein
MKLTFHGGTGMVTGALYLFETDTTKLLVDCGIMQGSNEAEEANKKPFPFNPKEIQAVILTHAHMDHSGRIPKLFHDGFEGKVYSTAPAKEEAHELFKDALKIMRYDQKGDEPLMYENEDIDRTLSHWQTVSYKKPFQVGDISVEFLNAGHILGSASAVLEHNGTRVVCSGDLGNVPVPLIRGTQYPSDVSYALIESAYGNRVHEPVEERQGKLEDLIEDTVKAGGTLMIPAFSLERTQQLLYELNDLVEGGRIPEVPIYVDSPLAIRLTDVYQRYAQDPEFFEPETIKQIKEGDEIFNFPRLHFTLTTQESKEINQTPPPKVIIAGSGMSTGGRILHHEMRYLSDPNSTILFVGFQPEGSLGRQIIDGASVVTIMGEKVPVRARVEVIGGYSAHADQPLLLEWVRHMKDTLKKVFVVQGELDQSLPLAAKIKDEFAVDAIVPEPGQVVELE